MGIWQVFWRSDPYIFTSRCRRWKYTHLRYPSFWRQTASIVKYNTMTTVLQYLYCFNKSKYVHNNNTFYISQVTYSSHCTFYWDTIVINYWVLFSICFFIWENIFLSNKTLLANYKFDKLSKHSENGFFFLEWNWSFRVLFTMEYTFEIC